MCDNTLMKIYLDIDDTLLHTDISNIRPANFLKQFLEYMLKNHDVYWLTTHCNGDATIAVSYLSKFVTPEITSLIMRIKPTRWRGVKEPDTDRLLKTDGIDMDEDFLWFDDVLSDGEEKALREKNKLASYVKVDLDKDPDFLEKFIKTN